VDSENTQVLVGLRTHSDVTVDAKGCCVFLSVQKHTFQRVSVKYKFKSTVTCRVMTHIT
jgi:uncharacterized membrane protein YhiD involved in acid resistance